ncbi:hypothetical protein BKA70DRAFT_180632 [Coprinopsis sp. MPI-PUGE-AT-0042]|nr:hypothetical protein BKA70DRAFT_180632 [Coprinopsis sp. MPI-PUGE-AT-0042]
MTMVSLAETTMNEIQPGPKDTRASPGAAEDKAKQRHILDIVFLQDSTGSQGPYIQACKSAITNICKKVSEHMGSPTAKPKSSSPSELDPIRFGLIAFRDHPPQDRSYVTKNFGFTSSVGEMKKWLGGLVASGGGDGPEASTAAMAEALNLEWRQSEEDDEDEAVDDDQGEGEKDKKERKKGVKVVKIVVLVTDAPPHGLGERGDGFPNGSPDQNDPLDIARQMAEHGISLHVIACEPTLSRYQHAVDFYRALTQITSGRMVPLLNASQLGDYIIGSALETLETEELLAQFQDTILEDVYGQGKSIEEVVENMQQRLEQQQVHMQTLHVDDVYAPSREAEANVASWMNAGKLGDARGKVEEITAPRMRSAYLGGSGVPDMSGGAFGPRASSATTPFAPAPPVSGIRGLNRSKTRKLSLTVPRDSRFEACSDGPGVDSDALRDTTSSSNRRRNQRGGTRASAPGMESTGSTPLAVTMAEGLVGESDDVELEVVEDDDDDDDDVLMPGFAPRGKISAPVMRKTDKRSVRAPPSGARPPAVPAPLNHVTAPHAFSTEGGGEEGLPQVQMSRQAVSLEQTRRMVMQGLSRHAKVGPGGKLTPKGVWAKADGGPSSGTATNVDGLSEK